MKNHKEIFVITLMLMTFFIQYANGRTESISMQPTPTQNGLLSFELTDAPADDTNIKNVFITVAAIKVNGKVFQALDVKQTIDLLAYQNGKTKLIGLGKMSVGTYSNITLVLDTKADAQGNFPGCYVKTIDGAKHNLSVNGGATKEIFIKKTFEIKENTESKIVLDFDVRKAIKAKQSDTGASDYAFVTKAELQSAVRVINKEISSEIKGICKRVKQAGKIIVYAYKKGTWNKSIETKGQGESNILFKNAVTSCVADASGNYTLAFLERGTYEVHVANYKDEDKDGKFELEGILELKTLLGLGNRTNIVEVGAGAKIGLDITITGLLP